ncbi:alanine--glyoxylate aminotransferase family protein [Rubellicoccus peritrichatus]|uniref:Alanine--glyoxylate aminotransferase family protein n=1 Tax=Rubellicoccus peritrichatus TaxID=3080537 RepID=A0AAQ3LBZ9_9BACT|nr:alanine--glyoxylate aminotransferase family protein [Puniceicoccus sp. CR14]WOO42611.1 alanine--glyoxylate aminotransferase family protein [Puniceicoccus sp. CR14]
MSYKLFIPGPVEVSDKTYKAMTTPVVGHRSKDFVELFQEVQPGLQSLFATKDPVYISTSSAWGVMEGSIRNLCAKKTLNCMSGAFSDKWFDVTKRCGKEAGALQFEWGEPVDPEAVRRELSTGAYDVITIIHNETSTGTMNPLKAIMDVVREFPDVISVVDTVSSFSVVSLPKDEWGIDVILTGSQKALALPPGLSLLSVSERAMERAKQIPDRGYYFDFVEFQKNYEKGMTPSTPVIPLIYGLRSKLEDIFAEGVENRFARHERLNNLTRAWVEKNGFELLPPAEFGSKSLCCVKNTRDLDIAGLNSALKERHNCVIDGGYGKLKGKTFRISNMGDETDETISELLANLDGLLPEFLPA